MDKKARRHVIVYCILFVCLVIGLTIILLPYFQRLSEPEYQAGIQDWINKMGGAGILLILAVQVVQVVIASTIIFALSKRFGKRLLYRLFCFLFREHQKICSHISWA